MRPSRRTFRGTMRVDSSKPTTRNLCPHPHKAAIAPHPLVHPLAAADAETGASEFTRTRTYKGAIGPTPAIPSFTAYSPAATLNVPGATPRFPWPRWCCETMKGAHSRSAGTARERERFA